MATSGSVNFNPTRNDLIHAIGRKIGIRAGTQLSASEITDIAFALNALVKGWQAAGIRVWKLSEGVVFPQANQIRYTIGPGSTDHATEEFEQTSLSAAEDAGETTLSVAATADIAAADVCGVQLDDATIHWTTIVSKTATTITVADALPDSSAAGSAVFTYAAASVRPLGIDNLRRQNLISQIETPLTLYSRQEYFDLPQKRLAGQMNGAYYEKRLSVGHLHVWQAPLTTEDILTFTCRKPLEDFDAATDNADFPPEWTNALIFNCAVSLASDFSIPASTLSTIAPQAAYWLDVCTGFDREDESILVQPDTGGG